MIAARVACVVVAALLLTAPDALAQGRGNGRFKSKGNGPAFCRSGAGHPVHGWQWCRERGWDRDRFFDRDDDRARRRGDRDRDRDRRDRDRRDRVRFPWPF